MRSVQLSVLHFADLADGEAIETLSRTLQVIASIGVHQVMLAPPDGARAALLAAAAAAGADVRPISGRAVSILGTIGVLREQVVLLARERSLYAVHLHGVGPCLLGAHALKGARFFGRVLCSPHLSEHAAVWSAGLLGRLLVRPLQVAGCSAVAGSLIEAHRLSTLLKRSAEMLPRCVSSAYFRAARREGGRPSVLADGPAAAAVDVVSRLSVLLNGRGVRVPIAWLATASDAARAQLEAASVEVLGLTRDDQRALRLARASAFIYVAAADRMPLAAAQAMACGVPCLLSDTPSHRALIRHGETGFIWASERDLLERLVGLLRDPAEAERMGCAARADAERGFTLQHFERAVLRAYGFALPAAPCAAETLRSAEVSHVN